MKMVEGNIFKIVRTNLLESDTSLILHISKLTGVSEYTVKKWRKQNKFPLYAKTILTMNERIIHLKTNIKTLNDNVIHLYDRLEEETNKS